MDNVLLFDPCDETRNGIKSVISDRCALTCKSSKDGLQAEIEAREYDLVFLDVDEDSAAAMELMELIHGKNPYLPVIITSKSEKAEIIVAAMNRGASDFLVHPVSKTRVNVAVDKAMELRDTKLEIAYHRHTQDVVYNFSDVIAKSPKMRNVLASLERFANTDSTILITGDTGTGKSFLSGTVHFNSPRRKKPFVKINCANIPENLLESELFGHEKGSFTGADKQRVGRFEQASGGTIFLDEIGEMAMGLQTKLLRVLEEREFERVGGNKTIQVDVRIIAATNKDLQQQVEKGEFREDLYYRINVLPIRLPSLRERKQCLLPLARLLLKKVCRSMRRDISGFTEDASEKIVNYPWPGNIRQLSNTIERAVILEDDTVVHSWNLTLPDDNSFNGGEAVETTSDTAPADSRQAISGERDTGGSVSLVDQERQLILEALEKNLWVQKNAAKSLGISPRSLNYKIRKLGIRHPHWRRNA